MFDQIYMMQYPYPTLVKDLGFESKFNISKPTRNVVLNSLDFPICSSLLRVNLDLESSFIFIHTVVHRCFQEFIRSIYSFGFESRFLLEQTSLLLFEPFQYVTIYYVEAYSNRTTSKDSKNYMKSRITLSINLAIPENKF